MFFDERFNFISAADGGVSQTQVAATWSTSTSPLALGAVKAPKNGYVYVYISNRSDQHVYFDDFKVAITAGNIIEENHYYSFGLKIAAISSKKLGNTAEGVLKNNYLYQGTFAEFDEDVDWHDFALRNYDAQIGKFVQMDPFTQYASPYTGMGNDPVNLIDPSGGVTLPYFALTKTTGVVSGAGAISKTVSTFGIVSNATTMVFTAASTAITMINGNTTTQQAGYYQSGNVFLNSRDDDMTKTYYPDQNVNSSIFDKNRPYDPDANRKHLDRFYKSFMFGISLENGDAKHEGYSLLQNFMTGGGKPKEFGTDSEMSKILSQDRAFIELISFFEKKLTQHLRDNNGNLSGFNGATALAEARQDKYIKGTWFMHTVMGGFSQVDALVTVTKKQVIIAYRVWDHFGAGRSDAVSKLPGLPSMYWLQHNSAYNNILLSKMYTPYIWNIKFTKSIGY